MGRRLKRWCERGDLTPPRPCGRQPLKLVRLPVPLASVTSFQIMIRIAGSVTIPTIVAFALGTAPAWAQTYHGSTQKYKEKNPSAATGRSGGASLTARLLLAKDTRRFERYGRLGTAQPNGHRIPDRHTGSIADPILQDCITHIGWNVWRREPRQRMSSPHARHCGPVSTNGAQK